MAAEWSQLLWRVMKMLLPLHRDNSCKRWVHWNMHFRKVDSVFLKGPPSAFCMWVNVYFCVCVCMCYGMCVFVHTCPCACARTHRNQRPSSGMVPQGLPRYFMRQVLSLCWSCLSRLDWLDNGPHWSPCFYLQVMIVKIFGAGKMVQREWHLRSCLAICVQP